MLNAPIPVDEKQRLASLRSLDVLDTEPEERFDRFTRLAKRIFGVPIALISLVDESRQWFKSRQGLDATETPRDISFCGHAICMDEALVVSDTWNDERFAGNPLVTDNPNIRFYAGHPLAGPGGRKVGTLCIIDREPRTVDTEDLQMLSDLAAMVEGELAALELATVDELTKLSNRRGFRMVAEKALAVCQRLDRSATLLYFDLDGFKEINDQFGHAEGDRALVEISDLLRETFRDSDVVARLGGDEFCVLLSGTMETQSVATVLERLASKIEARNVEAGRCYALAYSVGQIVFDPEWHGSIEALLREADRLMYEDKRRRKAGNG